MRDQSQRFREQGYAVFDSILSPHQLQMLRGICDTLLAEPAQDGGETLHTIGLGERRRFLRHRHQDFPALRAFVLGDTVAEIAASCGLNNTTLFNEQFVVKGAGNGARFAWHQDGAYVGFDHKPYLTIWIALDDATEDNGCVYILPRNLDDNPTLGPHDWLDDSNELSGYRGPEKGRPMVCKAGTIVAFSSLTLHSSGANTTDHARRAYVCQYSSGPLIDPATGRPKRFSTCL